MTCTHPVRLAGLCAHCGADISDESFQNNTELEQNMRVLHDGSLELRVTRVEAERISRESQRHLISRGRLSLIVDLDQTIVHTTISRLAFDRMLDLIEGHAPGNHHQFDDGNSQNLKEVPIRESINWEKLNQKEDLHCFSLPETPDVTYFIKIRPGTREALSKLSDLFEMHVYTMGSRSYARSVVKIIDPDGALFYDRVLSREDGIHPEEESQSILNSALPPSVKQKKNLQRLFPGDDRTVLIIDDRADVWDYCDNLVPVHPYTFFLGAEDMNLLHVGQNNPSKDAQHALKFHHHQGTSPIDKASLSIEIPNQGSVILKTENYTTQPEIQNLNTIVKILENIHRQYLEALDNSLESGLQNDFNSKVNKLNGNKVKMGVNQNNLNKDENFLLPVDSDMNFDSKMISEYCIGEGEMDVAMTRDNTLEVSDWNESVTTRAIKFQNLKFSGQTVHSDDIPDVKNIVRGWRSKIMERARVAFSGLIPRGVRPEIFDIWRLVEFFGGRCDTEIIVEGDLVMTTHLIAINTSTEKVTRALELGIPVIHPEWLQACFRYLSLVDFGPYLLRSAGSIKSNSLTRIDPIQMAMIDAELADLEDDIDDQFEAGSEGEYLDEALSGAQSLNLHNMSQIENQDVFTTPANHFESEGYSGCPSLSGHLFLAHDEEVVEAIIDDADFEILEDSEYTITGVSKVADEDMGQFDLQKGTESADSLDADLKLYDTVFSTQKRRKQF